MATPVTNDVPEELTSWLKTQTEARRRAIAATWRLAGAAASAGDLRLSSEAEVDEALRRFRARMNEDHDASRLQSGPIDRSARKRVSARRVLFSAGSVLAVVLCAVAAALFLTRSVTVSGLPGEVVRHTLPDGSTVELAGGTRLVYGRGLRGAVRTVELEGDGYFEVAAGERPFIVRTANSTAEVLGTAFGMSTSPLDGRSTTTVAVLTGRVRFGAIGAPGRAVEIGPGFRSTLHGFGTPSAPLRASQEVILAWRKGGFAIFDAPVHEVLTTLERRYGVTITADRATSLSDTISVYLKKAPHAQVVLADLCAQMACAVQPSSGAFRLQFDPQP